MNLKREMCLASRLQYYEAFVHIRNILRGAVDAAEDRLRASTDPEDVRSGIQVTILDLQCEIAALEEKRAHYDANISGAFVPKTAELQSLDLIEADVRFVASEPQFLSALKSLTEEGIAMFDRIQPRSQ